MELTPTIAFRPLSCMEDLLELSVYLLPFKKLLKCINLADGKTALRAQKWRFGGEFRYINEVCKNTSWRGTSVAQNESFEVQKVRIGRAVHEGWGVWKQLKERSRYI
jgi:hypothetical protein